MSCEQRAGVVQAGKFRERHAANNEQWSRIEQWHWPACIESQAWSCFMWELGLVTPRVTIHWPRARKVGGRWAGTLGNSDKALVIHGNVTRNTEYVFLCLGLADTDRWVAARQLDSQLLFTNLHIYNNWHNRHVRHRTDNASPLRPESSGVNNPELLHNNDLMVIWWLMLIRLNLQIDTANTSNTSAGRQKVSKLKLFSTPA